MITSSSRIYKIHFFGEKNLVTSWLGTSWLSLAGQETRRCALGLLGGSDNSSVTVEWDGSNSGGGGWDWDNGSSANNDGSIRGSSGSVSGDDGGLDTGESTSSIRSSGSGSLEMISTLSLLKGANDQKLTTVTV